MILSNPNHNHDNLPNPSQHPKAQGKKKRKTTGPSAGDKVEGIIELVRDDYLVISLPQHGHTLCYCSSSHPNDSQRDVHAMFKPMQQVVLTIRGPTLALMPQCESNPRPSTCINAAMCTQP